MSVVELKPQASFDDFWAASPKRVGKPLTQAKWDAITSPHGLRTKTLDRDSGGYVEIFLKATPEELVDGMKRYARNLPRTADYTITVEDRFLVHPATWLNQGRWMD